MIWFARCQIIRLCHLRVNGMTNLANSGRYESAPGVFKSAPVAGSSVQQLSQITRNIRRTLDLETIWQQTVDGLGLMFDAQRVWVCGYQPGIQTVAIAAEYRSHSQLASFHGQSYRLDDLDYLSAAIAATQPIICRDSSAQAEEILAISTRYQDQPNGLIVMYPQQSVWSEQDLELITELAEQVGTAVAHARQFGERHALAVKLQQANASLMEKHRQLEEARRQAEAAREQAEEASRLKSEFLANTSHELRTPLNGMIGFLKLVLDGMADDPEEQEDFIQEAHKSALHLLDLINDVLDIAKIEAGKMQLDMGPVSLRELFNAVESFTRPMAEQKKLAFEIHLPATRDEIIVNGNYQRLLQVMLNLVGNAIKFTHEGGVTISAEIKLQKSTFKDVTWPGTVKVSVADTGIGVSLEKQDRLFQTFSQVDGERTRQYGGTGLGLAISQKLVEAMGGVVQFISMGEGLGSTVTFTTILYHEPVLASTP
ncbi:histidine kinase [filamentous cyanobacterium CCP5]|nr:histidine kinase [filamentous cyanobacterium CCP5]